jgi:ATP-dependent RNA helicase DHX29
MLERPSDFHDITHIVLDEVHERSIDTDFLLIVLRRLMRERAELKVILMSATVDAERFSSYLNGAPVLNIPGRTYPVEVKYLEDVIELVDYSLEDTRLATSVEDGIGDDDEGFISDRPMRNDLKNELLETLRGYTKQTREAVLKFDDYRLDYHLITKLLANIATKRELYQYSKGILVFMPGLAEIRRLHDKIINHPTFEKGWVIHILHSSVSSEDQEKAFIVPPEGVRKIVIATNIAETGRRLNLPGTIILLRSIGITIPDITAVIDSGKEKLMRFVIHAVRWLAGLD